MTRHKHQDTWDKLEIILSKAVEELSSDLNDREIKLFRDFIENREYGVTFDIMVNIIRERSIAVTNEARDNIYQAADLMNVYLERNI
ncbi:MAG: MafI family immunity protein [Sphingosinicella sp.]|nr:MafI family immunity protein [Sphingosinicella sp.]